MEAFNNNAGNCFGLIPSIEMEALVDKAKDPVKKGTEFGNILYKKADCKGRGGGDRYFMAIDYLEVMLAGPKFAHSGTVNPKWDSFWKSALVAFGDNRYIPFASPRFSRKLTIVDSQTTHCPIKRIKALVQSYTNENRENSIKLSAHSGTPRSASLRSTSTKGSLRSAYTTKTESDSDDDFGTSKKAINKRAKFYEAILIGINKMRRKEKQQQQKQFQQQREQVAY